MTSHIRALVLHGGAGPERAGSIVSGETAAEALKEADWHVDLFDITPSSLDDLRTDYDVALVATHGWYGEDGKLQGWLEMSGIPYTGSGVLASASAMHKPTANVLFRAAGLHVPDSTVYSRDLPDESELIAWADERAYPFFCKPTSGGGSLGAARIDNHPELVARLATRSVTDDLPEQMLSSFIEGMELSVAVRCSGDEYTCLPILETDYESDFYDYDVKRDTSMRTHTCPADLDDDVRQLIEEHSVAACRTLGCYGYARVDFRLEQETNIPWILEVNTVPGMSAHGNLATMCQAAGMDYDDLIADCVALAIDKPAGYFP